MKKLWMVCTLGAFGAVGSFAADLCTGGGTSLDVYVNAPINNATLLSGGSTGTCNIGNYVFSNFDVFGNTGWVSGDVFNLTVAVDNPASGDIAFLYSATNGGSAVSVGDFILTFTITPGVTGIYLFDGTAGSVTENVCSGVVGTYGTNSACQGPNLNTSPLTTNTSNNQAFSLVNPSPTGFDVITKDISGGSEIYQAILPEPMTFTLMGAGLLGLGILGRRRASK
jgi:hypothetical protein